MTDTVITLETTVQRNTENLLTSIIGDEIVMMDVEGGNYIGLNKIGRIIWDQMDQPILVKILIENLTMRFNVTQEICLADTLEYLQNMYLQRIISIC